MANERIGGAAQGAAIGTKIMPGWGTAIGAVAGALFGGGGSYAQGTGLRAIGYVDKSGFHGTVYGLAQNGGQKYQDALTNWAPQPNLSAKAQAAFVQAFGADSSERLQVDFVGPLTETGSDPQFSDAFASAVLGAAPPKSDYLSALADAVGGGSSVKAPAVSGYRSVDQSNQAGIVLASPAPATGGNGVGLLALLAGAFYMVTHV